MCEIGESNINQFKIKLKLMKRTLEQFAKEHELSVLSEKEQELLDEFGGIDDISGNNALANCSTNNCKGGNCAAGCGTTSEKV